MIYAGIKNSTVVALIDINSDDEYIKQALSYENLIDTSPYAYLPQIGFVLDSSGSLGPLSWKITKLAFQQRFTLSEQMDLQVQLNSNNVLVQTLNKQFELATYIDLKRLDVQQGLGAMAQAGLLTVSRMNEILNTPPTFSETYKGLI